MFAIHAMVDTSDLEGDTDEVCRESALKYAARGGRGGVAGGSCSAKVTHPTPSHPPYPNPWQENPYIRPLQVLLEEGRLTRASEKCSSNKALKEAVNEKLGNGHRYAQALQGGRRPAPGTPAALKLSQKDAWWNAALAEVLDGAVLVIDSQFAEACKVRTQSHLPEWELHQAATAQAAGATTQVALTTSYFLLASSFRLYWLLATYYLLLYCLLLTTYY